MNTEPMKKAFPFCGMVQCLAYPMGYLHTPEMACTQEL